MVLAPGTHWQSQWHPNFTYDEALEQFSNSRGGYWLAGAMEYALWNLRRGHKSASYAVVRCQRSNLVLCATGFASVANGVGTWDALAEPVGP